MLVYQNKNNKQEVYFATRNYNNNCNMFNSSIGSFDFSFFKASNRINRNIRGIGKEKEDRFQIDKKQGK